MVLGGGGARGLAHIPVLEALDELGVEPVALAGTSIGAMIGAGYAAGMSGRDIRTYATRLLGERGEVLSRLLPARAGRISDLFAGAFSPALLDAEKLVAGFMPEALPESFARLRMPLTVVATDFYARAELAIVEGDLASAIAASIAIPGLFRPVLREGRVLVDGGAVNPLPFDLVLSAADIVVACDVTVGPSETGRGVPGVAETLFSTIQIMMGAIVHEKLRSVRPHVLVRPRVDLFRALDFFRVMPILRAAETVKDEIKQGIEAAALALAADG